MQGRKPKPTNLKVLNGNPGKRALNKKEPKPKTMAKCPSWLSKQAKKEWKRLAPELEELGLLTNFDQAAFATYCESVAQYEECIRFLHEHGMSYTVHDEFGQVKMVRQYPQLAQANQSLAHIRSLAAEFGFTPSARSRVETINHQTTPTGMGDYLRRKTQG